LIKERYKLSCLGDNEKEKSYLKFKISRNDDGTIQNNIQLEQIYTKEEYRKGCFASKLIDYLKIITQSEHEKTGIHVLIHPTSDDISFENLIAFYEKNGFAITRTDESQASGYWSNIHQKQKALLYSPASIPMHPEAICHKPDPETPPLPVDVGDGASDAGNSNEPRLVQDIVHPII
jgi:hypothetical protein